MTAANPAQAADGTVDDEGPAEVGRSATSGAPPILPFPPTDLRPS